MAAPSVPRPSRRPFTLAAALLLPLLAALPPGAFAQGPPEELPAGEDRPVDLEEMARNSFIFLFREDVPGTEVRARSLDLASRHGGRLDHIYRTALRGFSATLPPQAAERLARDPRIAWYGADGVARATGRVEAEGGPATAAPQSTDWGVARVCAPAGGGPSCPPPAPELTAWILDTGVDLDHPDLDVDLHRSRSFVRKKSSPDDGNGHGTHVAGIVAARNNGIGTVGVAAGAKVVSVRVLDSGGSGLWSWVIAGIDYVAQSASPGDVANMSLGGPYSLAVNAALENAARTCRFSVAAGNESDDGANHSPASASGSFGDRVFTVSAADRTDRFAPFSNWGNPPVDFAAPGVSILSLYKGGRTATLSGTSMAAPHVAGLLLLGQVGCAGYVTGDLDDTPDLLAHLPDGPSFACPPDPYRR